ncbi:MAG: hypothetical protein AB7O28_07845 [Vicinamibacterales bacterium]
MVQTRSAEGAALRVRIAALCLLALVAGPRAERRPPPPPFPPAAAPDAPAACSTRPALARTWDAAWHSLGIAPAESPEALGDFAATRWFGSRNWFPVDGQAHLFCGRLSEWSLYDGQPFTAHELDIHPNIVPGAGFEYLIDDLPSRAQHAVRRCRDGRDRSCIYGEATASTEITTWLLGATDPGRIATDRYQDSAACIYGPWVMERVHGWLPEIHPFRQFWAAEDRGSTERVALVLTGDSSNRYGDPDQFKAYGPRPQPRPWTRRGLRERLGLAFEIAAGGRGEIAIAESKVFGLRRGAPPPTVTRSFGDATLRLDIPAWMSVDRTEACSAEVEGRPVVRGVAWLDAALDPPLDSKPNEAAGAALSISRRGFARPVPSAHLAIAPVSPEPPTPAAPPTDEAREPMLTMEVLDLRTTDAGPYAEPLQRTAAAWGLEPTARDWHAHGRQTLTVRAYYTGRSVEAREKAAELNRRIGDGQGSLVDVTWSFEPVLLDPDGAARPSVGGRAGPQQYGILVAGGDAIRTHVTGIGGPTALKGSREGMWRSLVEVTPPGRALGGVPRWSPRLRLTARLADREGRSGTFSYDLHTYLPVFAEVSKRQEPPATFLLAVARRVNRPAVPPAEIARTLGRDWATPAGPDDAAARRARIFRTAYLTAARDNDLDPDEWLALLDHARRYADARWP